MDTLQKHTISYIREENHVNPLKIDKDCLLEQIIEILKKHNLSAVEARDVLNSLSRALQEELRRSLCSHELIT